MQSAAVPSSSAFQLSSSSSRSKQHNNHNLAIARKRGRNPPPGGASAVELSADQLEELSEVFKLFDLNQRDCLDAREFKSALRALGFDVKKEHIIDMLTKAGKDFTDTISFDDFCSMLAGRMPDKTSREEAAKLFRLFDEDGAGAITFRSLKKVAQDIGETLTDEEIREMIEEADRDGDGVVSFEEFYRVMRYRNNPLDDSDDEDSCDRNVGEDE